MTDPRNKVAEAFVEVTIDGSSIGPNMAEIKKEVAEELNEVAIQGDIAGERLTGSFNKAGDAIEENTQKIVAFQSKLTAAIGVVTGITGAAALAAGAFVKFGRSMLDAAKEAGRVRDEVEDLNETIARVDPSSAISNLGDLQTAYLAVVDDIRSRNIPIEEAMKAWDALDAAILSAKQSAKEDLFDQAEKSAVSAADALREIRDATEDATSATPEIDAAWSRFSATIEDINEQVARLRQSERDLFGSGRTQQASEILGLRLALEEQSKKAANDLLDLELSRIDQKNQAEAKAQAERAQQRKQEELELQDLIDQRQDQRLQKLREDVSGIFGADVVTALNNLTAETRQVGDQIARSR